MLWFNFTLGRIWYFSFVLLYGNILNYVNETKKNTKNCAKGIIASQHVIIFILHVHIVLPGTCMVNHEI